MRPLSLPSTRRFTSCSVLALATVLVVGATPAGAQSFLGNGTVTSGTGTITNNVPGSTNVTVTTTQTVIDWVPFDNAIANNTSIAFQNSGTVASFSGPSAYAVLNRINPADSTRSISMNGTIQTIAAGAGGAGNGSIYFYSPGGFVIGASAVMDVGSLVLSASPITVTGGNFISGFGTTNTVVFGQASQAGAAISTNALSQTANSFTPTSHRAALQHAQHQFSACAWSSPESSTIILAHCCSHPVTPGRPIPRRLQQWQYHRLGHPGGDIHRAYLVAEPKNAAMTSSSHRQRPGFNRGRGECRGIRSCVSRSRPLPVRLGRSAGSTGRERNLDVRDSLHVGNDRERGLRICGFMRPQIFSTSCSCRRRSLAQTQLPAIG